MRNLVRTGCSPAVLVLISGLAVLPAQAQGGFGAIKTTVTLERRLPAVASLPGTKIAVKVTSEDAGGAGLGREMRDTLETELLQDDHALSSDSAHPEVSVDCTITNLSTPPPQTVTHKGISNKGKLVDQKYQDVSGNLTVAYQAKDARSGQTIDSFNIAETYQHETESPAGNGSKGGGSILDPSQIPGSSRLPGGLGSLKFPGKKDSSAGSGSDVALSPTQVQQLLMQRAVKDIASRLVDTDEKVEVLLATGGELRDDDRLAQQRLWSRMAESLETMTPFSSPEQDAYRLYDLGVAYEAMAYEAKDPKAAKNFLEQAAINYGKAVDDNKDEKYFLEPQTRIETAAAHYNVIENRPPATVASVAPPPASPSTGAALSNDDIIKLAKASLPDSIIIKKIKNSTCAFDTSADSLVKLKQAGVSAAVIAAMVDKQ